MKNFLSENDQFSVIRYEHKLGSPISGIVSSLDQIEVIDGSDYPSGCIHLKTKSLYPTILPYNLSGYGLEDLKNVDSSKFPSIGEKINAVVFNFVDGRLYLTSKPSELLDSRIKKWQQYYNYIDTIEIGEIVLGSVKRKEVFGLFIDIGSEFEGIIDIASSRIENTTQLPLDQNQ